MQAGEGGVHGGGGTNTHNHSWYDNGVGYVYPAIRNLGDLVALDLAAVPTLGLVQGELARVHAIVLRLDLPALPVCRVLVPRECGER